MGVKELVDVADLFDRQGARKPRPLGGQLHYMMEVG